MNRSMNTCTNTHKHRSWESLIHPEWNAYATLTSSNIDNPVIASKFNFCMWNLILTGNFLCKCNEWQHPYQCSSTCSSGDFLQRSTSDCLHSLPWHSQHFCFHTVQIQSLIYTQCKMGNNNYKSSVKKLHIEEKLHRFNSLMYFSSISLCSWFHCVYWYLHLQAFPLPDSVHNFLHKFLWCQRHKNHGRHLDSICNLRRDND